MDNEKKIQDISKWIIRDLQGEISDKEKASLEDWRNETAEHERFYREIKNCHLDDVVYERYRQVQNVQKWEAFRSKLIRKKKIVLHRWLQYAAVVCICFVAGYFLLVHEEEPEMILATSEKIVPGDFKAVLSLPDGQKVYLGDHEQKHEQLEKEYGIVETDSLLAYHEAENKVEYHKLEIPRGGEYMLELADGSRVWINSGSVLEYPTHFGPTERKVRLMEGEAYFEVAKDVQRPFYVETKQVTVNVLGTGFNVLSYLDEKKISVTLAHGSVKVQKAGKELLLRPDEQFSMDIQSGKMKVEKVNAAEVCAWRNGMLYMDKMTLEELGERLGRWFDCDFVFKAEELKHLTFTGSFRKYEQLDYILSIIKSTVNIKININGKKVEISN